MTQGHPAQPVPFPFGGRKAIMVREFQSSQGNDRGHAHKIHGVEQYLS